MYQLIDSGDGLKLERFGEIVLVRPCPVAVWRPSVNKTVWDGADAIFSREEKWVISKHVPATWKITVAEITFQLKLTEFGHLGIFPEQQLFWQRIPALKGTHVLNLFAYSGGSSIAAARGGAQVTHVDAAKGMIEWAKINARLNDVSFRFIVDDVMKYLQRACKRGERYDGIILDPPTFGRGKSGEVFKIERDLIKMLELCKQIHSPPGYVLLTCHTPGYTPLVLQQVLHQLFPKATIEVGEMSLTAAMQIPSGVYALAHF